MKKLLLISLLLAGCSTATQLRDYATISLYRAEGKVLMFARAPCSSPDKPAMVIGWAREKDIEEMVVLCDPECNCRLTKKTRNMKLVVAPPEGICQ